jgi:hypothetical protein
MDGAECLPLGLLGLWEGEAEEGRLSTIRSRGKAAMATGVSPPLKNSKILLKQDR